MATASPIAMVVVRPDPSWASAGNKTTCFCAIFFSFGCDLSTGSTKCSISTCWRRWHVGVGGNNYKNVETEPISVTPYNSLCKHDGVQEYSFAHRPCRTLEPAVGRYVARFHYETPTQSGQRRMACAADCNRSIACTNVTNIQMQTTDLEIQ